MEPRRAKDLAQLILPVDEEPVVNVFEHWKPQRKFVARLDRPLGGRPVEDIVSEDRDR